MDVLSAREEPGWRGGLVNLLTDIITKGGGGSVCNSKPSMTWVMSFSQSLI